MLIHETGTNSVFITIDFSGYQSVKLTWTMILSCIIQRTTQTYSHYKTEFSVYIFVVQNFFEKEQDAVNGE
jgi:hypothetical protein